MNDAQQQIVKHWIIILLFFTGLTIAWLSPIDNKQLAGLIVAIPLFIWISFNKKIMQHRGYGPDGLSMGEFIQSNKVLKLWLVFYCTCILPFLIYKLYTAEKTPYGLAVLTLCLLLVPMFVTSEIQRYRKAGENA